MPAVLRTAKRGQVTLFNQDYQAAELMRRDVDGREVSVRYDIHDPNFVRVYTVDGDFVCDALWNANRIDAMPKPVVQIARERRVATAVKRREQQIQTALRELDTPIDVPGTFALEAPAAAVVELPIVSEAPATEAVLVAPSRPFFDAPSNRYEWLMRNRDQWTDADGAWLRNYTASEDYADLRDYYEGRGMGWSDAGEQPGFKSAL
jgi:putative transposase